MPSTSSSRSTSAAAQSTPALADALAGLPPRVRVHELARRAGLNSKDTIAALAKAGVAVGSASSSVDREVAESLLTGLLTPDARPAAKAPAARASRAKAADARKKTEVAPADAPATGPEAAEAPAAADAPKPAAKRSRRRPAGEEAQAAPTGDTDAAADGKAAAEGDAAEAAAKPAARKPSSRRSASRRAATGDDAPAGANEGVPSADGAAGVEEKADDADDSENVAEEHEEHDGSGRGRRRRRGGRGRRGGRSRAEDGPTGANGEEPAAQERPASDDKADAQAAGDAAEAVSEEAGESEGSSRSRRRRRGRGGQQGSDEGDTSRAEADAGHTDPGRADAARRDDVPSDDHDDTENTDEGDGEHSSRRRRRRRRHRGESDSDSAEASPTRHTGSNSVQGVRGSTRLEAKRQRRRDSRDSRRRPQILSEAEFLARRESVDRVMAVRQRGDLAQVALLEDGILVEHFVSQHGNASMIGDIYLGRVQNVLPSMEAAFVDIGRGRNAVLYAGEVNWDMAGLEGKERRIETALSGGDTVLVQVSKDPIGHKGARLTTQISLPGRFLVYVPGGGATGISRKLPDTERKRLKKILDKIVPSDAGVIIRTAAEGVGEEDLAADVERLKAQWTEISEAARKGTDAGHAPTQLYAEPDTLIKVVRDLFNSDINRLLVDGDRAWQSISEYVLAVAPELADRVSRYIGDRDVFDSYRIDEQIAKALQRKVRLPSGGSLVIDRTEAMTVIDVNTGKFTGSGGNLEETVTRNNLEAAEEIVRQLRLRDIGGIIVVDFIDMVLESNRDLVLRRLTECLGRDRTRHQVAEVTSLGLIQMTRKRMGLGLVEAFSEPCSVCNGRGIVLHDTPSDSSIDDADAEFGGRSRKGRKRGKHHDDHDDPTKFEPLVVDRVAADAKPDPRGPKPPAVFRPEPQASADVAVDGGSDGDVSAADDGASTAGGAADGGAGLPDGVDGAADVAAGRQTPIRSASRRTAGGRKAAVTAEPATPDDEAAAGGVTSAGDSAAGGAPTTPAAKPARRRRAAGRPAGAPASANAAVEIVLPAVPAAVD